MSSFDFQKLPEAAKAAVALHYKFELDAHVGDVYEEGERCWVDGDDVYLELPPEYVRTYRGTIREGQLRLWWDERATCGVCELPEDSCVAGPPPSRPFLDWMDQRLGSGTVAIRRCIPAA